MTQNANYRELFIDYLTKQADSESPVAVREDPPGHPPENTEAVNFSTVAQEGNKDTKEGVLERILANKERSTATERALIGAVIAPGDYETGAPILKVEKVSHPRSQTLLELARAVCGRA